MEEMIVQSQKNMSEEMNFTFFGEQAANQAGHVANMTNQLRTVLFDVRVEAMAFQVRSQNNPKQNKSLKELHFIE